MTNNHTATANPPPRICSTVPLITCSPNLNRPAISPAAATAGVPATAAVYQPLGAAKALFSNRHPEILLAGPAGTGKTRAALEKIFLCLLKYDRTRALLVRKTRASLTQSVLVTLEEKVIPPGHSTLNGPTRAYRNSYVLPNRSELVIGGMDNVNRIMSSEYDLILACEATELSLEDWEKLLSRLRNGIMPYQQAIAECNPSYPDHWLNLRASSALMHRLLSRHEDNPAYYNLKTKSWTPEGLRYIATLGRLSGVRRRRLLEGAWAAPEGLVYETFANHLIPACGDSTVALPTTATPRRACASIDWGWRDPAAVLIGIEATDGTIYIVEELYQSQLPTPELLARCRQMFDRWDVELCFADRSRPEMTDLFRNFNIPCRSPKLENIQAGIARVDSRLILGKLKIFDSCQALITEAARYQYTTNTSRPSSCQTTPGNDHAMDALRYLITGMEQTSGYYDDLIATTLVAAGLQPAHNAQPHTSPLHTNSTNHQTTPPTSFTPTQIWGD